MVGFFDCNCVIGMRSVRRSGVVGEAEFYSLEDLLAEMDYAGIGNALVYHSLASVRFSTLRSQISINAES